MGVSRMGSVAGAESDDAFSFFSGKPPYVAGDFRGKESASVSRGLINESVHFLFAGNRGALDFILRTVISAGNSVELYLGCQVCFHINIIVRVNKVVDKYCRPLPD